MQEEEEVAVMEEVAVNQCYFSRVDSKFLGQGLYLLEPVSPLPVYVGGGQKAGN